MNDKDEFYGPLMTVALWTGSVGVLVAVIACFVSDFSKAAEMLGITVTAIFAIGMWGWLVTDYTENG